MCDRLSFAGRTFACGSYNATAVFIIHTNEVSFILYIDHFEQLLLYLEVDFSFYFYFYK